jgi:hypothetical protein
MGAQLARAADEARENREDFSNLARRVQVPLSVCCLLSFSHSLNHHPHHCQCVARTLDVLPDSSKVGLESGTLQRLVGFLDGALLLHRYTQESAHLCKVFAKYLQNV